VLKPGDVTTLRLTFAFLKVGEIAMLRQPAVQRAMLSAQMTPEQ
jgi:hypothetical protein